MAKNPREDDRNRDAAAEPRPGGDEQRLADPPEPRARDLSRDELEKLRARLQNKFH